jgi:hypothetical protein
MIDQELHYDRISQQDTYPEHSHKWIVGLYTGEHPEFLHRYFGPFSTKQEAKVFALDYRKKYTTPGFISSVKVFPLCEVVNG